MRSLVDISKRWQRTIENASSLADLRRHVKLSSGDSVCISGLRSVCWKIFLLFQSTDQSTWSTTILDSRDAYSSLRYHYLRYIVNPDELGSALDPLDDDKNSPWNTLRQDEELRAEILQDVERCMPEEQYFRLQKTQNMLLDILFVFCKMNEDTGYRQGMHELLAPILWVVEQDVINPSTSDEEFWQYESGKLMKDILSTEYVEHDAFTLFTVIMRTAKSFYELGDPERRPSIASVHGVRNGASTIVERSKRIHEVLLAQVDPELAAHLTQIEILPQIFLIRWIRLLFGREFPFESLLTLWDTLFAEDSKLDLVDLICVAMLLRIRWQLLEADYSVALTLLLKYPPPKAPYGPQTFVEDASVLKGDLNVGRGATMILKYSDKEPSYYSLNSRPLTPVAPIGQEQKWPKRKSPLQSPAKFLQQQGGLEAILQGAAKGAFERGERLGINQAVRDAVGEVKKNMQGLQNPVARKGYEGMRWSLDEGRSIASPKRTANAVEQRNKQLSEMLGEALVDLRGYSKLTENESGKAPGAVDLAIAKIQFVQVYLQDSSIPLPSETNLEVTNSSKEHVTTSSAGLQAAPGRSTGQTLPEEVSSATSSGAPHVDINGSIPSVSDVAEEAPSVSEAGALPSVEAAMAIPPKPGRQARAGPSRPAAVPTRSTLAQSSFAFMLEPDEALKPSVRSTSPTKAPSPFLASSRRHGAGSREKAAFLFGDEPEDQVAPPGNLLGATDASEGFNLESMRGSTRK